MRYALITGGAGFVGYHLARHLVTIEGYHVTLTDNLWRGKLDGDFEELLRHPRVDFVQGDITNPGFFQCLGTGYDEVYHLAAVNGTKFFYELPHEVLRINITSLFNVLEWMREMDRKPRLCFTSSNEAYAGALEAFGQLPLPTPESVPLVVSDVYNPRWTYGGSKLIGELMVINYGKSFGIPAVIVRPHNFYGPRAGREHVIPQMCARILAKEDPFTVYGEDETRSFCYIDDAVSAMHKLMARSDFNEHLVEIFHIGSEEETRIGELAQVLFSVAGWHPSTLSLKEGKAGSVKRRLPDTTKVQEAVSWVHNTSLREGLARTFAWYKSHKIY